MSAAELALITEFKGHKGAITALCVLPSNTRSSDKSAFTTPSTAAEESGAPASSTASGGIDDSQSKAGNAKQSYDALVAKIYQEAAVYSALAEARPTPAVAAPQSPRRKKTSPARVVTAGADHTIKIWDPSMPNTCKTLEGHEDVVTCLAVTASGLLISGGHSFDCTVKVWDSSRSSSDALLKSFSTASTEGQDSKALMAHAVLSVCALEVNGRTRIVAGTHGGKLHVWDLESGEKINEGWAHVDDKGVCHPVTGLAVLPNKPSTFVSVGLDREVKYWDSANFTTIESLGFGSSPTGLAVCEDSGQSLVLVANYLDCVTVLNEAGNTEGVVEDLQLDERWGKSTMSLATVSVGGKALVLQGRENGVVSLADTRGGGAAFVRAQSYHQQGVSAVGLFTDVEEVTPSEPTYAYPPELLVEKVASSGKASYKVHRLRAVTGGRDGSVKFWGVVNKSAHSMVLESPVAAM